jgi:hypothetical protein
MPDMLTAYIVGRVGSCCTIYLRGETCLSELKLLVGTLRVGAYITLDPPFYVPWGQCWTYTKKAVR